MRRLAAAALVALAATSLAQANGRPPQTNGIAFRPGDSQSLYVRSTFGLLISHDNGCSFRWVCEQAIGYGGTFDPKYAIGADGTLYATTFEGLRVSRDQGCTWSTATAGEPADAPGSIANIWIDALDIAPNGDVWVATAESAKPNNVFRSVDGGVTFEPRNVASPSVWWKSVKVARTDPQRVYVTGYQVSGPPGPDDAPPPPRAHFLRSSNGGDTWAESPLTGVAFGSTPIVYAAAVDPTDPAVVLMTSAGANAPAGDRLYRSADGGETFTEVLVTTDTIRDVVFHGSAVLVATLGGGSFQAPDGVTFAPIANPPQFGCLGDREGTLFGCGANWQPDFQAVTTSTDGAAWAKVFRFVELAGPLACPVGTPAQTVCDPLWPALREQFGATGPTCGAVPDGAASDAADPGKPAESGGCCDTAGAPAGAALLAGLAILVGARRKRRCCT